MPVMNSTTKIDVKPDPKINLETENFAVKVIGWEENLIQMDMELEYHSPSNEELTIEDIVNIDSNEEDNSVTIKIKDSKIRISKKTKIKLHVPHVCTLSAKTENGSLKVRNIQGENKLQSENGSIKLDHVNGKLECQSENGTIILESCNGDFSLITENGSVRAVESEGPFKIQTENGSIKLKKCIGSLTSETENGAVRILQSGFESAEVSAINGSIMYEFLPIEKGQFSFQNNNGKIQLLIPEELEYKIQAMNKMGRFHISLPGDYERVQNGNKHQLELNKGAGNVKIIAQNHFGSINLLNQSGKKFDFDTEDFTKIFDTVIDRLPEDIEIDTEKIKLKLEKAKEKLNNIKLPDPDKIQKHIDKAMKDVNKEIRKVKIDLNLDDLKEKANEAITTVVSNVKDKLKDEELTDSEQRESNKRSNRKILEMLQEGKISVDEAERLIKAMEE
ncbi:MAG: hypothetical protein K9N09_09160 [Candidatus Cloacimonetes bacterium]|nr:hypothetical protein [Candidatus Cloacimonadota bacterium]MCF7814195.1 hypothetical protein [Candidatus Cloacimonadota bacterium]MCF7868856.1 hypothetical protein [Candidatus Cloacimonadota bacterium]MCF7884251.1 hypothetical protein [Candidatus Cloacimonadota bacterium]